VVDLAFLADWHASVYKSFQTNFDKQGNVRQNAAVQQQVPLVRQLAEWGMRGMQGSSPRL
jgi:hypothetical protein